MSDDKILELLEAYDSATVRSDERKDLGAKIDEIGGKMKPSHIDRHIKSYLRKMTTRKTN